ncbi:CotH kinase family protein [Bacteroidota bacterium]
MSQIKSIKHINLMVKLKYQLHFYFLFFLTSFLYAQDTTLSLYINEFMASNYETIYDQDFNEYGDWIEIYNGSLSSVNLSGYFLTDKLKDPTKWEITDEIIIEPDSFVIFWANGKDQNSHCNFKLAIEGGEIGLYLPDQTPVDTLSYSEQITDISFGRNPDGSDKWTFFNTSTPGTFNNPEGFENIVPNPEFSIQGGFYNNPQTLEITSLLDSVHIYYTLDGSEPAEDNFRYTEPLFLDKTSVVRAVGFREHYIPSSTVTNTYFINENITLPVISINTNPENFWDDKIGIYVAGTNGIPGNCSSQPRNWNQDWERPISLEFFETNKTLAFKLDAGVKINGACSRLYPQKSLAIFVRKKYGTGKINYQFFEDKEIYEFNNFILRSSAQDWWRTMFRDGMIQTVIKQSMNIDYQEYRPSVVFLNGEYFGIHNLREKLNEHYLKTNHNVDPENIDLIEISKEIIVNNGDREGYDSLINFVSNNNMSLEANYSYVITLIDVDEYIDYQIAEIYSANADWPGSNVKLWRTKNPAGKWRWMIYDLDFCFGGNGKGQYWSNTLELATDANGPSWPNPPWSTLLFKKLLDNDDFKNEFIQRFAFHISTTFETEHVIHIIDSLQAVIAPEIPQHKLRWTKSISFADTWEDLVEIMRDFARNRPINVRGFFNDKFNISGSAQLTIDCDNSEGGLVSIYNERIPNNFEGVFFKEIPIKLEAIPLPGFRFTKWQGLVTDSAKIISITLSENSQITALFEKDSTNSSSIVINEINYNSSINFDTEDWVELYNNSNKTIDISGWMFKDEDDGHIFTFPGNTILEARRYLVLCRDTTAFGSFFPNISGLIGNFEFGLSSDGELIRLFDIELNIIDSLFYKNSNQWPAEANGNGSTLELLNPNFDNALAKNWGASSNYGSPGNLNGIYTDVGRTAHKTPPFEFSLEQNYPNPFNPTTIITYTIPTSVSPYRNSRRDGISVVLKVFDILGREIAVLVNKEQSPGRYKIEFDGSNLPSGVYFYCLQTGNYIETKKMTLLR